MVYISCNGRLIGGSWLLTLRKTHAHTYLLSISLLSVVPTVIFVWRYIPTYNALLLLHLCHLSSQRRESLHNSQLPRLTAASSWAMEEWKSMEKAVAFLPPDTQNGAFYRAVLAIRQGYFDRAQHVSCIIMSLGLASSCDYLPEKCIAYIYVYNC